MFMNKRYIIIGSNQKKFINLLLNREHRSITLDRIRKFDCRDHKILIVNKDKVKKEAAKHFSNQFRKRNHRFNMQLIDDQAQIYELLHTVDNKQFDDIANMLSEKE